MNIYLPDFKMYALITVTLHNIPSRIKKGKERKKERKKYR